MRVVLLYLLALTLLSSCSKDSAAPDLVLTNGKIWTADDEGSFAEAVAIRENKILQTGNSAEISKLAGKNTTVVDVQGRLVVPGFNDAHIHFLSGSLGLARVDLNDARTPMEIAEKVLAFAKDHPESQWIMGRGWQYTSFESGMPDATTLHAIDTVHRPVFLTAYDGHSAWANRAALKLAGVDSNTPFDGFGKVIIDTRRQPTGALLEGAKRLVSKFIADPTRKENLDAIRLGLKMAARLGITSVHNANGDPAELSLYRELLSGNELTIRYRSSFSIGKDATDSYMDSVVLIRDSLGTANPMLKADAIKFMIDGVIESHTGAMLEPYSDVSHGEKGTLSWPADQYRSRVQQLDAKGFHLTVHAIGDGAVREALDAYELATRQNPARERRHRIEHIESVSPVDIPRFKTLGVWASMQPIHADPGTSAVWTRAAGPERTRYAFAWNSLMKAGASLVYGSDWPACINVDPLHGIHIAVNRRTPDGYPEGGYVPEQAITVKEALLAYTRAGAISSFEENVKGQIKPGYLADLVVLSQDLFTIPPMDIAKTKVWMTIFDGRVIYQSETRN